MSISLLAAWQQLPLPYKHTMRQPVLEACLVPPHAALSTLGALVTIADDIEVDRHFLKQLAAWLLPHKEALRSVVLSRAADTIHIRCVSKDSPFPPQLLACFQRDMRVWVEEVSPQSLVLYVPRYYSVVDAVIVQIGGVSYALLSDMVWHVHGQTMPTCDVLTFDDYAATTYDEKEWIELATHPASAIAVDKVVTIGSYFYTPISQRHITTRAPQSVLIGADGSIYPVLPVHFFTDGFARLTSATHSESTPVAVRSQPILVLIDDSPFFRKIMRPVFLSHGFDVLCFATVQEALLALASLTTSPHALVVDASLPEADILEAATRWQQDFPAARLIALLAQDDARGAAFFYEAGYQLCAKRTEREQLVQLVLPADMVAA
jgi:CheY-like chemotaxis protein